ncbi:hypothetical protein DW355_06630 [Hylemonella gracilis]|uniref:Uncharacterized protein n=1 Tax=Hylemonella gracilis TaxID=80880 RepID=A0A4P6UJB1_9BURK|nr:hypothetical protein [Hylemonella gracilis]QBK04504.1 hypothetical protein DW355_06630 [Hylemonella gracilis]
MTDIDDEDPKVRRNLVAFSSAILLFAWLELPMKAVTEKFVSTSWSAEPLRVWLAIAGVLIYLAMRFHFIGGGKEAFSTLGDGFLTDLHWQVGAYMKRIEDAPASRKQMRHPLADAVDFGIRTFAVSGKATPDALHHVHVKPQGYDSGKTWRFSGVAEINLEFFSKADRVEPVLDSKEFEVSYSLPFWLRAWYLLKAAWTSFIFSERAITGMAPVWLATTASFVTGLRLGTLWSA